MNIAFDSGAIKGSSDRGIGKYTACQINTLVKAHPLDHFYYFNLSNESHMNRYLVPRDNLVEVMIYTGEKQELITKAACSGLFGIILKGYLNKYGIDFYYITSPFDDKNTPVYLKEWFEGRLFGGTFYDLIPYIFKNQYLGDKDVYRRYMTRIEMIKQMDQLFPISESAGEDLVHYLGFAREHTTIIYGAPDDHVCRVELPGDFREYIAGKYGITKDYIICVGGADYRKNIEGLIVGYSALPHRYTDKYQLVIVGKLPSEVTKRNRNISEMSGTLENVIFTGFVSDEDLLKLYNGASICAFTSLYEGYGMPVIEAYACDLPVVSSNNSSLKEVAGEAAFVVDPYSARSICEGIMAAIDATDEEIAARKAEAHRILSEFTWDRTAELTYEGLKSRVGIQSPKAGIGNGENNEATNEATNEDTNEDTNEATGVNTDNKIALDTDVKPVAIEHIENELAIFAMDYTSEWSERSIERLAQTIAEIAG